MKVFTIYLKALLLCIVSGVIVALGAHCDWYFLILLIIPVVLGALLCKELLDNMIKYIIETTVANIALFVLLLMGLPIAAICEIDERTPFGITYAGSIVSGIVFLFFPVVKLPEKWKIFKKDLKRFNY